MNSPLPFLVRVIAGAVGVGIDTVRRLPSDLPSLGVEVAGTVTRWGLQARQQLDELAQRGDELLSAEPPISEHPAWATFDDEPASPADRPATDRSPADESSGNAGDTTGRGTAPPNASDTADTADTSDAPDAADADAATTGAGDAALLRLSASRLAPQLTGLTSTRLNELLRQEQTGRARPAVITLLQNRIVSLAHASEADVDPDSDTDSHLADTHPADTHTADTHTADTADNGSAIAGRPAEPTPPAGPPGPADPPTPAGPTTPGGPPKPADPTTRSHPTP